MKIDFQKLRSLSSTLGRNNCNKKKKNTNTSQRQSENEADNVVTMKCNFLLIRYIFLFWLFCLLSLLRDNARIAFVVSWKNLICCWCERRISNLYKIVFYLLSFCCLNGDSALSREQPKKLLRWPRNLSVSFVMSFLSHKTSDLQW